MMRTQPNPTQQTSVPPVKDRQPNAKQPATTPMQPSNITSYLSPNNGLIVFTNGSNVPDPIGGSGVSIDVMRTDRSIVWQTSKSVRKMSTSYAAERLAIDHTLKENLNITDKDPSYTSSIVILCDCLSAIKTARNPSTFPKHSYRMTCDLTRSRDMLA